MGEPMVVDGEVLGPARPGELVVRGDRAPTRYVLADSPLWAAADRHSLWGRVVTDPREVAAIAERVARYARPWWRRVGR